LDEDGALVLQIQPGLADVTCVKLGKLLFRFFVLIEAEAITDNSVFHNAVSLDKRVVLGVVEVVAEQVVKNVLEVVQFL